MLEPLLCALERRRQLAAPLRDGVAEAPDYDREAGGRQRRVGVDDGVNERVHPRPPFGRSRRAGGRLTRGVDPDACFAAGDAQVALVVQGIEQVSGGIR